MQGILSLNSFLGPVDDHVTTNTTLTKSQKGDANPKRRRTQDAQTESTPPPPPADTTDVHAHVAHSDAEEDVCACCADQPSKCVEFTATESWPTLCGSASEPPALERLEGLKRKLLNE